MSTIDAHFDDAAQQQHATLLGMWLFLATELLLFGGLFTAFVVLRVEHAQGFAEAARHLDLRLATVNTVMLLTSGLTMTLAERAVTSRRRGLALIFLAATLALGAVFLAIKGYEWHHEHQQQLMPIMGLPFDYPGAHPRAAQLFFDLYYAMTGLHAAHMLAGLGLLGVMLALVVRWRDHGRLARRTQVAGLYWAFVDVAWIFMFTLLYLLRT